MNDTDIMGAGGAAGSPAHTPLLRVATAGSVDDGKSTLIGRLLYDCRAVLADQLAAVESESRRRGHDAIDLALLTDGLRAEREQGITIDVAWRYFATARRKFVLADTPGHAQDTRNMVSGASTAQLAILLVDARRGLAEQTRRHAFVASLLGIRSVVVCINKMDLVGYAQDAFDRCVGEVRAFASKLDIANITFVPISALRGDNVVTRSEQMPWYAGPTLLHYLETVHVGSEANLVDARLPVQAVVRPQRAPWHDFRGIAGQVQGGVFKAGDEVVVLPSGFRTRIASIRTMDGELEEAFWPLSVVVTLVDDLDVGRGDMIVKPQNQPQVEQDLDAMLCWFSAGRRLTVGDRFWLRHTTRETKVVVREILYRVDVDTLHRLPGDAPLAVNDIGRVRLRAAKPICLDEYRRNRLTGSLILVDENDNETVAAGMLR